MEVIDSTIGNCLARGIVTATEVIVLGSCILTIILPAIYNICL